ncbi:MAG TPA: helix-turn-helix transcriptional regulator [Polyangiaceae bacterium]|nr:helix-turn-helix transcriptional regulator [Polyangiaceae bacterium]
MAPAEGAPADGEVQRGFAERLRRVFDASGLTHAEFAKRSGLPKGALSVILKRAQDPARMGPSIVTVVAIARGLGVSPGWLAFGEGPVPAGAFTAAKGPATTDEGLARGTKK